MLWQSATCKLSSFRDMIQIILCVSLRDAVRYSGNGVQHRLVVYVCTCRCEMAFALTFRYLVDFCCFSYDLPQVCLDHFNARDHKEACSSEIRHGHGRFLSEQSTDRSSVPPCLQTQHLHHNTGYCRAAQHRVLRLFQFRCLACRFFHLDSLKPAHLYPGAKKYVDSVVRSRLNRDGNEAFQTLLR